MRTRVLVAGLIAVVASLVLAASASAIGKAAQVTTNSDAAGLTPPNCSLRDAITAVTNNADSGGCVITSPGGDDKVTFAPAMSGQTINLGLGLGEIAINDPDDLQITGPGMNQLTLSGNDVSRVLNVQSRTAISGLSLVHGKAPVAAGVAQGGAIKSTANVVFGLTLTDVKVADSAATATASSGTAFADGAGIHSTGPLTLNQSVVTGNHATATQNGTTGSDSAEARGGGIFNQDDITLTDSTISDNQATATTDGAGGAQAAATAGIRSDGHLEMGESTMSGNAASATATGMATANARGALYQAGSSSASSVEQSTIAANTSDITAAVGGADVGGLDIANDMDIRGSTIALNGPVSLSDNIDGANILVEAGTNTVENTIIADPRGLGENCVGTLTSNGFNDDYPQPGAGCFSASASTDLTSNPLLAAGGLANNGGLTQTIALQPTSPMIDQGSNADLADPTQDQRGASFPRPVDFSGLPNAANGTDIGAFEVQQACPGFTQSTPSTPCPSGGGATPITPLAALGGSSAKLNGSSVGIPIACPAGGEACQGSVSLTGNTLLAVISKKKKIGSASFSIPAGQRQKVKVRLSKPAIKTVKQKGKLVATVTITTQGGGGARTSTGKLKIKR